MKKLLVIAVALVGITSILPAQDKAATGTGLDLKFAASSTLGWDIATSSVGMETAIRYVDLWFEVLPTADRGYLLKSEYDEANSETWADPYVSLRLNNIKWALKLHKSGITDDSSGTGALESDIFYDDIGADLNWGPWYFRIAAKTGSLDANRISLRFINDKTENNKGPLGAGFDSYFGLPLLNMSSSVTNPVSDAIAKTGHVRVGYKGKDIEGSIEVGSKSTWKDPASANGLGIAADFVFRPVTGWEILADFEVSYDYIPDTWAPIVLSLGTQYDIALTDKAVLQPFVGFDGKINNSTIDSFTWELGGGVNLFWAGKDKKFKNYQVDYWNDKNVGATLSANVDQRGAINVAVSAADETSSQSLIPNLGFLAQFEWYDITKVWTTNTALGVTARLEYQIERALRPDLQAVYKSELTGNQPTGNMQLNSQIGFIVTAIKNFYIDLKYHRTDLIGVSTSTWDPGVITLEFLIKNH